MNKQESYKKDPLRHYINPESIERAPEGFTERLMINIKAEALSQNSSVKLAKTSLVPFISTAVILILVIAAFLIPGIQSEAFTLPGVEFLNNIKISLPVIDITNIFKLQLPVTLIYVLIGILILPLFDRVLDLFFHREK